MRTMSATLQAACGAADCEPAVEVTVSAQPCERPDFRALASLYSDGVGDQPNAAAVAVDGSILRIRTPAGGGTIYRQRVTDPLVASQWSTWTAAPGSSSGSPSFVDVWVDAGSGRCWQAIVGGAGGTGVYAAYSDDHGASWTGWAEVFGGATVCRGIGGWADNGVVRLVAALNPVGDATSYLVMFGWAAGVWSVLGETAHNRGLLRGLGMALNADGNLYVLVCDGAPSKLCFQEWLLATSAWGSAGDIVVPGVGSTVTYREPRYLRMATPARAVLVFIEMSNAPSYGRAMVCWTPVRWWVTEEVAWRFDTTYGLEVVKSSTHWYFIQSDRAYRCLIYTGASGEVLTVPDARIAAVELESGGESGTALVVWIDNSGGWYDQAGVSGVAACVRRGSQLAVKLGYRTSAGVEGIWQEPCWITRVGYVEDRRRGECYLRIEARGSVGELRALRARRQYQWSGMTVGGVVQRIWWRVCGRAEASPSGNMALVLPYFAVGAGESWGDAVRRLCRMTGTVLRFYNAAADGIGWGAAYPEVVDLGVGSSVWTFGGSGQVVRQGEYWRGGLDETTVEVFGTGYYGVSRDWEDLVWPVWRDVSRRVVDVKLDAQGEVDDRAGWESRWLAAELSGGRLRVFPVPGLEVGDVVTVTEAAAGLSSAGRVVLALQARLERRGTAREREFGERGRAGYEQVVTLGGLA